PATLRPLIILLFYLLFFNPPAPTMLYTLSLHDALPIYARCSRRRGGVGHFCGVVRPCRIMSHLYEQAFERRKRNDRRTRKIWRRRIELRRGPRRAVCWRRDPRCPEPGSGGDTAKQ